MTDQQATFEGFEGSDLAVGDYVAIIYGDGQLQSPVIGQITRFVVDSGETLAEIHDAARLAGRIQIGRLVRTSVR